MENESKTIILSIRLPREMHEALKREASKRGMRMSQLIKYLISRFLEGSQ